MYVNNSEFGALFCSTHCTPSEPALCSIWKCLWLIEIWSLDETKKILRIVVLWCASNLMLLLYTWKKSIRLWSNEISISFRERGQQFCVCVCGTVPVKSKSSGKAADPTAHNHNIFSCIPCHLHILSHLLFLWSNLLLAYVEEFEMMNNQLAFIFKVRTLGFRYCTIIRLQGTNLAIVH